MIYLFSSVYDDITILPQFLDHYFSHGVSRIIFNINTFRKPALLDVFRSKVRDLSVEIAFIYHAPQTWLLQNRLRNQAQDKYMAGQDWAILADLDEFIEFPASLRSSLEFCDAHGYNCMYGDFLDRVAESGQLPPLLADVPVNAQFPIGIRLTRDILKAPASKVVALKGGLRPSGTCKDPEQLRRKSGAVISTERPTIHHYKWHAGVLEKLRERAALYKSEYDKGNRSLKNFVESQRFLDYYEARGRIVLEEFMAFV